MNYKSANNLDFESKVSKSFRNKRRKSADELQPRIVSEISTGYKWKMLQGDLTMNYDDEEESFFQEPIKEKKGDRARSKVESKKAPTARNSSKGLKSDE